MNPPNDFQRVKSYIANLHEPAVAVFDVGTRGARLLVAPKRVPDVWKPKGTFCNVGYIFNLGLDVDAESDTLPLNSVSLRRLTGFLQEHARNLRSTKIEQINAIGTAVFRWLKNQEEVLAHIKIKTGLNLEVISEDQEARIAVQCLSDVLERTRTPLNIADEDFVLLLDQGGGSLELAWMQWSERHNHTPKTTVRLLDELGSVALRHDFFTRNASNEVVRPEVNRVPIRTQTRRISDKARAAITALRSLPTDGNVIGGRKRRLHAIAVGSAPSYALEACGSKIHGRKLTKTAIDAALEILMGKMEGTRQQVLSIYKSLYDLEGEGSQKLSRDQKRELDKELAVLYGLPVYGEVLQKCGLDSLTLSGYPLRYCYYVSRYLRNLVANVSPDSSGPYVFVSYSHKDKSLVYDEISLLASLGYRVWFDDGIPAGANYRETLASKIKDAAAFLVFMTPDAAASPEVFSEVHIALRSAGKPVFQVQLRKTELPGELQYVLGPKLWVDRYAISEGSYRRKLQETIPSGCLLD